MKSSRGTFIIYLRLEYRLGGRIGQGGGEQISYGWRVISKCIRYCQPSDSRKETERETTDNFSARINSNGIFSLRQEIWYQNEQSLVDNNFKFMLGLTEIFWSVQYSMHTYPTLGFWSVHCFIHTLGYHPMMNYSRVHDHYPFSNIIFNFFV